MRGYDQNEYEDLDEYEEEGEEQEEDEGGEEEYEEEEAPQPTKEELEYLELRQRLKESIRKQMKKESGLGLSNSNEKNKTMPYDNYGSFFGPSQPVIAQRVIHESKSLLENQHLVGKASKPHHDKNKSFTSSNGGSRPQGSSRPPKVVNQLKVKVQKLKDTRDYSFLLSDDAELPAPSKDPPARTASGPSSEARSVNMLPKSKQPSNNSGKQVPNGYKEGTPVSRGSRMDPKAGTQKLISAAKPSQTSITSRKQLGSNNGSGPGRPMAPKGLPSKISPATAERRVSATDVKSSAPVTHKPPPSKLHSSFPKQPSVSKQQYVGERKEHLESGKGKVPVKQPVSSAKPQMKPPAKLPSRPTLQEERSKKKPVTRRFDDEEDDYNAQNISGLIRGLFNYNPNKYANYDDDDDDSDMEANFDDILREERKSTRIARQEDEEELRKIEEEERRERMRKLKKRKLSQH